MGKIIIIGGGIAGLSAGIYAQMNGFSSEIYEKNAVAGGQCMGWDRKGHHIDNCIHWLTGTKKENALYDIWEKLGAIGDDVKLVNNDSFITSTHNGKRATLWRDLDKTQKELLQIAPEDKEEIIKFIANARVAECCEMPVSKPMDMMNMLDFIKTGKKMAGMQKIMKEYGDISIEEFGNRFKNPLITKLMTDYMPLDYSAFSLLFSYAAITSGSGDIPEKGSLAMVLRMIERYKKLGGVLHLSKPVKKVIITNGTANGIMLCDGSFAKADYVICATDTSETFSKLVDYSYMSKKLKMCYENRADYPVFSGFQVAFSVSDSSLAHETIYFDCTPFVVAGKKIDRIAVKSYSYEPSFAPMGKSVLQINVLQKEADFEYWKSLSREEYKQEKERLANELMKRVIEGLPTLENHIELLDCWTPLTYERYCNAYKGSYMAFIMRPGTKSQMIKGTIKGVSNLFIASQWLMSPGGLPTAAATGKFAIQRILKKEGKPINI